MFHCVNFMPHGDRVSSVNQDGLKMSQRVSKVHPMFKLDFNGLNVDLNVLESETEGG